MAGKVEGARLQVATAACAPVALAQFVASLALTIKERQTQLMSGAPVPPPPQKNC
jgi:hypothetical protein